MMKIPTYSWSGFSSSCLHFLSSNSFKRFRRNRDETVNTTQATAEPTANVSSKFPIGDLNNRGTEIIKAAPLMPNPKIDIAKILFIETPTYSRVIKVIYYSSNPNSSNLKQSFQNTDQTVRTINKYYFPKYT